MVGNDSLLELGREVREVVGFGDNRDSKSSVLVAKFRRMSRESREGKSQNIEG